MDDSYRTEPPPPSGPLRAATWGLYIEGSAMAALVIWLLWLSLTAAETAPGAGVAEALIAAGVAALLFYSARTLSRGQSGPRGIAVFLQLLLLPVGYHLAKAQLWPLAIAAWTVAVTMTVLLAVPSTRRSLDIE